jgi:DivIVA domain-containing protein
MPITPEEIATVTFSRPPLGKRGYHEEEVDAFLDAVQHDLTGYLTELEQVKRRDPLITHDPVPPPPPYNMPPPPPRPETITAQASRILELAQQTAEQVTTEARAEAEQALRDANNRAANTISQAQQTASETVRRAEEEEKAIRSRIDTLRAFEENYHDRLVTYMEGQLEAVRGQGPVAEG